MVLWLLLLVMLVMLVVVLVVVLMRMLVVAAAAVVVERPHVPRFHLYCRVERVSFVLNVHTTSCAAAVRPFTKSSSLRYSNMDRLIRAVNSDGRIRTLYSDPETYIDAKHAEQEAAGSQLSFPVFANDDFIPISQDFPPGPLRGHMYWTGYVTTTFFIMLFTFCCTTRISAPCACACPCLS